MPDTLRKAEDIDNDLVVSSQTWMENGNLTVQFKRKNSLWRYLNRANGILKYPGGPQHVSVIAGEELETYTRIKGYEPGSVEPTEGLTQATFEPSMISMHIMLSKDELTNAMGPDNKTKLYASYVKVAMDTIANKFSVDLYSNGMLDNQINGLAAILQNNGGGRYAGVDPSRVTDWKNQARQITGGVSYTTVMSALDACFIDCDVGETPDLGLVTVDLWLKMVAGQRENTRYGDKYTSKEGKNMIEYRGAELMYDHNSNFGKNAQKIYLINTDNFFIKEHRDAAWQVTEKTPDPAIEAEISGLLWKGFMGTDYKATHGVVYV